MNYLSPLKLLWYFRGEAPTPPPPPEVFFFDNISTYVLSSLWTKGLKDTFYNVCRMYIDNLLNIGNVTDIGHSSPTHLCEILVACGLKMEN